jgi:KEOPS complex subunit Cgi121
MDIQIISGTIKINNLKEFLQRLIDIGSRHGITIQALNADLVAGSRHLLFAVEKAIRSFESGRNLANNLGMEIMLYASGHRQIERALAMGVKEGDNNIAVVLVGENGTNEAAIDINNMLDNIDGSVLDYSDNRNDKILEFFNISSSEIKAVGNDKIPQLVLERVALVDIIK